VLSVSQCLFMIRIFLVTTFSMLGSLPATGVSKPNSAYKGMWSDGFCRSGRAVV